MELYEFLNHVILQIAEVRIVPDCVCVFRLNGVCVCGVIFLQFTRRRPHPTHLS